MKQCRNRRGQLLFGHGWDRCCRCSRRMMSLVVVGRGRRVVVVAGTVQSSVSTTPTTTTASSTTSSTAGMRTSTIVASILISLGWSSMMAVGVVGVGVVVLSRGGCFDRLGTGGTVHRRRRRRRRRGWCGGCNFGVGTTSISSTSTSTVGLTRLMIATSSSSGSR